MKFGLWDAPVNGAQHGATETLSVPVSSGLFTVVLNANGTLGPIPFLGDARWLDVAVECPPGDGYTSLGRVAVAASPYALGLAPGASVTGRVTTGSVLSVANAYEQVTVPSFLARQGAGTAIATAGAAILGDATEFGIIGRSAAVYGVWGQSTATVGVFGSGPQQGVGGQSAQDGVGGKSTTTSGAVAGVRGIVSQPSGVAQLYPAGVVGDSNQFAYGVAGYTNSGTAVYGDNGGSNTTGYAGVFNGRVVMLGDLTVNGTFSNPSDAILKTDIVPLSSGLDEVRRIRPVSYRWAGRPGEEEHPGVVAQELQQVLPELVVRGCDPDAPLGVDALGLVPVLVHALQEEDERVRELEKRLAAVESRVQDATARR
jgi:hypothetical protein